MGDGCGDWGIGGRGVETGGDGVEGEWVGERGGSGGTTTFNTYQIDFKQLWELCRWDWVGRGGRPGGKEKGDPIYHTASLYASMHVSICARISNLYEKTSNMCKFHAQNMFKTYL